MQVKLGNEAVGAIVGEPEVASPECGPDQPTTGRLDPSPSGYCLWEFDGLPRGSSRKTEATTGTSRLRRPGPGPVPGPAPGGDGRTRVGGRRIRRGKIEPRGVRTVESCPYYTANANAGAAGPDDRARCELLARLIGPAGAGRCHVGRDACEACVNSFPPTPEDINYVIASMIVRITDDLIETGASVGEDRLRAIELRDWAERCIPVAFPDEAEASGSLPVESSLPWAPLDRTIPMPVARCGPSVREWAVGITTAPRRLPTLEFGLAALMAAGWEEPRLFVNESDQPLAGAVRRGRQDGPRDADRRLAELLPRAGRADAPPPCRRRLHDLAGRRAADPAPGAARLPGAGALAGRPAGDRLAVLARPYTQAGPGWYALPMQWIWGALAFVFPADLARRFLADPEVIRHRGRGPSGLTGIDVLVGRFAYRHDLPVYFPTPSLVQHIGHVSALWENAHVSGSRRAASFAGAADPPVKPATRPGGARFVRTLNHVIGQGTHRSGWPYAIAALQPLADPEGVLLDDFIEQTFVYPSSVVGYSEPWVGIVHHPPNMPSFMFRYAPADVGLPGRALEAEPAPPGRRHRPVRIPGRLSRRHAGRRRIRGQASHRDPGDPLVGRAI